MNGAESLVRTLVGGGVNVCFANPGTSEMYFVAALNPVEGMRCAPLAHCNSSSSAFASLRSGVSKPSVNQP